MRDFKGMKRQRSRNRNGGGGGGGQGGGGKPQHNTNRAFDSNGPEGVKVRGAAQHVYEKYQQLARDAQTAGDRVLAENYLQHAEHYFRLMRAMQPQRPLSEIIGRDQFVSGYDIDFEDESGGGDGGEAETESESSDASETGQDRQPRFESRRDDSRQGDNRNRDEQPRSDRYERFANDRAQTDRFQNDRGQGDRNSDRTQPDRVPADRATAERPFADRSGSDRSGSERSGSDRPREDRAPRSAREDRPRFNRDDRAPRTERADRDPLGMIEPEATPLTTPAVADEAPMLRADDGEISHAPAFLQVRAAEPKAEGSDEPRRPRRRRAPATFTAPEAAAPAPEGDGT
jgi:hypothetical protein